ncbi:ABC transporter ATP-binding protein [Spirosoma lituiforme]
MKNFIGFTTVKSDKHKSKREVRKASQESFMNLPFTFALLRLKPVSMSILRVENLTKTYSSGGRELTVLHSVNFTLEPGDTFSIVGPSGSGKTTLLGLCAGLDRASSGSVYLNDVRLDTLNEDQRAAIRNQYVGFIFQNFQLLPTLTALENVMVPLELRGEKGVDKAAQVLLERVGLGQRGHHYPTQLSGGEQQRVSLARAFANRPRLLFADEPTGNLDADTSATVVDLLFELNREAGTTLVLVTHDLELASRTQRVIRIKGGTVVNDTKERKNERVKE